MTFLVKNFALASLAAAALVACGGGGDGGSSNGTPATTSQSATYTTSFSIGDTWQIKLEGVTVNNVAQTSGNFIGTVLVGGYAAFPTGTLLTGTWSYSDKEIELNLKNSNDEPVVIAFTAEEQPTPSKEGETAAVIQIASFTEDGKNKTVAAIPSPESPVSDFTPGEIPLLTEDTTYHHVSLRFKRSTGEFDATSSETGVVTKDGNTLSLGKNNNFVFGEATDSFYPAYQQKSDGEFAPRGLLYTAGNGNVNFDYIDDTLTGMSYLVNLKQSESIANGYSGNWKCTSLIDPKLYAQLKITTATAISGQSVEITDFYNGKKVGGPHTEKFEAGSDGLIQLRDGNELTKTFVYPISENYFIVNDKTGDEPRARFLSCVPTAAQPDTGNGGNDSGNGGNDSGTAAGNFTPVEKIISQKDAKEVDPEADPNGLSAEPIQLLYFATTRATYKLNTYKYINKKDGSFGYDLGDMFYINDISSDGGEFFEPSNADDSQWFAKSFFNGAVIMGCEDDAYDWRNTFVAALADATPITDLSELNGSSYTNYSCDYNERNGYNEGKMIVDGVIKNDSGDIPVDQLFSSSGFSDEDDTYYYKAYKTQDGAIFAVGHEKTNGGINLTILTSHN